STEGLYDIRIAAGILEFNDGAKFIQYRKEHEILLIKSEVAFLTSQNKFCVAVFKPISNWNFKCHGNNLVITTESWHRGSQFTTKYMYSVLQFDWFVPTGNMSLVQNASTFFGRIDDNMIEKYSVLSPLTPQFDAIHKQLGPLITIDLYLIPPWKLFRSNIEIYVQENVELAEMLSAFESYDFHPTPLQWKNQNYIFYGGNPLCGFGSTLPFVQETFGFDDACATQKSLTIQTKPFNSLCAYLHLDGTSSSDFCQLLPPTELFIYQKMLVTIMLIASQFPKHSPMTDISNSYNILLCFVQLVGAIGNNKTIVVGF
ncbi:hypothetical protein THRCLA_11339, partial [Thraustotheca clavata]